LTSFPSFSKQENETHSNIWKFGGEKKVFFLMKEGGKRKSGQMKMRSLDEKGIKIEKNENGKCEM